MEKLAKMHDHARPSHSIGLIMLERGRQLLVENGVAEGCKISRGKQVYVHVSSSQPVHSSITPCSKFFKGTRPP